MWIAGYFMKILVFVKKISPEALFVKSFPFWGSREYEGFECLSCGMDLFCP